MPAAIDDDGSSEMTELPFPPVTREHILHCSYHYWHAKYRSITPKARLIPLNQAFLDYLRADGIVLAPEDDDQPPQWSDTDSGVFSASDNPDAPDDSDDESEDVLAGWRNIHTAIANTIAELGGEVAPKLNWSAPKDATWMNANTMICRTPNEIYLLLKSSDFVTHDLEHAFDDTVASPGSTLTQSTIPYHLVLRKAVGQWNPSVEFRCFVRGRRLLCMCQRDLNHFEFLSGLSDENFTFDVYVPAPYDRVWLVDFNPWAPRTDPLLFGWLEILTMPEPPKETMDDMPDFVRLPINGDSKGYAELLSKLRIAAAEQDELDDNEADNNSDTSSDADEEIWLPELRLISKTDPEAYNFSTPQYSAHKLPKDVVDASQSGEGLREFARDWENILAKRRREDEEVGESSGDE
ncbi:uncharacterized protein LTR77_010603 [Saxophila tyrrhenica]|uniref:Cell division cycle protein 123 n=1 Tax=Saxophila tyrrhenica TaxID=1690608 RepID=A0AAV9NZ76_9PEZI|nr:hypothetical protein LTR77_010603 [Saxophila tyrrhenica]